MQFGLGVHGDHARGVDAALQPGDALPRQRRALRQIGAVQQHGVVARKVVRVVLQRVQLQLGNARVGGVDVGDVDARGGQRGVRQAVVDGARALRQAVARGQPGPAVGAAQKFLRQRDPQIGLRAQVGDAAQPALARQRLGGGQRVAVGKTQRHTVRQPQARQFARDGLGRAAGGQLEDFLLDGAQVFGIDVDRAGLERLQHHRRVAQARPVFGAHAGCARRLRDDLAQDIAFGKALGADHHALVGLRNHHAAGQEHQKQERLAHARQALAACLT